jgi:hypothetical protein
MRVKRSIARLSIMIARRSTCENRVDLTMQNTNTTIIATGDPLPTRLARSQAKGAARPPPRAVKIALVLP